jgi:L-fuculose-phosphate aldolase
MSALLTNHTKALEDLASYCRVIYEKGFAAAASGNLSIRVGETILITPSTYSLREIEPEHLVTVYPDGHYKALPGLRPSSELLVHQAIYNARPDIQVVFHAHPPRSTALCITGQSLEQHILPETMMVLGPVPLLPYRLPGSESLAELIGKGIQDYHALLLANHGVIATGMTLKEALHRLELLEYMAEVMLLARQWGPVMPLTEEQVSTLWQEHQLSPTRCP